MPEKSKLKLLFALLFFIFLVVPSCKKSNVSSTSSQDILSRDKMVEVLTDIHLTEAALRIKQMSGANMNFYTPYYYRGALAKHGISTEQFRKSIRFYMQNPEKMDKIYTDVITNLSEKQNLLLKKK